MGKTNEYKRASVESNEDGNSRKTNFLGNPLVFLILFSGLTFVEAAILFGYFGGVLTTIERRFQISSTTAGTLSTLSEISGLSILIFICYFGSKLHIPRVIGISGILIGVGMLLNALPHFLFDPYEPAVDYGAFGSLSNETVNSIVCSDNNVEQVCTDEEKREVEHGRLIDIWPIAVGQVIIGFGTASLYPLSIPYLDDSTKDSSTMGLYIAILYFIVSVGPFAGFSISAKALEYRTDFYKHNDTSVQSSGSGSIGAWWLGFVVLGTASIAFSIPFLFFPRKLNVWESSCMSRFRQKATGEEFDMASAYRSIQQSDENTGLFRMIKGLLVASKRIVTNLRFVNLLFGIAAQTSVGSAIIYFFAKYLETQFDQDPATAAFLTGMVLLPGSLLGIIVGGILTSCFRLKIMGMCRMMIVLSIMAIISMGSGLFIKCPQRSIAGITKEYNSISYRNSSNPIECNAHCLCPDNVYQPICEPDGLTTHISACHAGCNIIKTEENQDYDNNNNNNNNNKSSSENSNMFSNETNVGYCSCFSSENALDDGRNRILHEVCPRNCNQLPLYLTMVILSTFLFAISYNPYTMLIIRSVDTRDRALSMAFLGLSYRLLALIPAPIYFGAIIESSCILKSSICGQEGACLLYDTDVFRKRYVGLGVALQVISLVFFVITTLIIKRELSQTHTAIDTDDQNENKYQSTGI